MNDIWVENIVKTYDKGQIRALDHINLEVAQGELFGLIGPDGAGKTSLFRILTTLLLPDQGHATVNGLDIIDRYRDIRKIIGYMPGKFSLYQDLTVEENIRFFAQVHKTSLEENYTLIHEIYAHIEPFKDRRAGQLSGGMKQKLALCCALIHRPSVLFLDEPTTGVDAVSRKEFWDMLKHLKQEGITIMVSTPYMDEANRCERIALIQQGTILSVSSPQEIVQNYPGRLFGIRAQNMRHLLHVLRDHPHIQTVQSFGDSHHITLIHDDSTAQNQLLSTLRDRGIKDVQIKIITPTIEDCFIQLMSEAS